MKKIPNKMGKIAIILMIGDIVLVFVNLAVKQYLIATMFLITAVNIWLGYVINFKGNDEENMEKQIYEKKD